MITVSSAAALGSWRRAHADSVGFVPTMGALHEGHLSLVRRARDECARVVASIFVNPAQFDQGADLAAYPRDLEADTAMLAAEGVDVLFAPLPEAIYPAGFQTWVEVTEMASRLEGAARPGHFRGVATVVLKLLHLVRPERAYFGEKDAQQLALVRTLVRDLAVDTAIVGCPTVRAADGLALSSRNARLSPAGRQAATALYRALEAARDAWRAGQSDGDALRGLVGLALDAADGVDPEYVSLVDPVSFVELAAAVDGAVLCLAARVDGVRLIDNVILRRPEDGRPAPASGGAAEGDS